MHLKRVEILGYPIEMDCVAAYNLNFILSELHEHVSRQVSASSDMEKATQFAAVLPDIFAAHAECQEICEQFEPNEKGRTP